MSHLHVTSLITRVQELLSHPMLGRVWGNPMFSLASPFEWAMLNHARNCVLKDSKQDIEELDEAGVQARDERFRMLATLRHLHRTTAHEGGEVSIAAIKRVVEPKDMAVSDDRLAAQTRAQIIDERMAGRLGKEQAAKRYVAVLAEKKRLRDIEVLEAKQTIEDVFYLANASDISISSGEFDDESVADFNNVEHLLDAVQDRLADGVIWAWRKLCDIQSHRDGVIDTRDELRSLAESLTKELGVNLLKVQAQGTSFADEIAAIEKGIKDEATALGADLDSELAALPVAAKPAKPAVTVVKSEARIAREQAEHEAATNRAEDAAKKATAAAKRATKKNAKPAVKDMSAIGSLVA